MAKNNLGVILGNMGVQGVDRIRGGGAQINFQAANVGLDPEYERKSQEIGNFSNALQTMGQAFGNWMEKKEVKSKQTGEDRANYLMQHFTPDQLQAARQDGTLQFQDDPYAMKALHMKVGQTISMDVDDEISRNIQSNKYNSRKELDADRAAMMNKRAGELAKSYGVEFDNPDLQSGMNSQVVERNIMLYGQHDKWLDGNLKNKAQLQQDTENVSLFKDESFLKRPDSVQVVFSKMSQDQKLGGWSNETQQANTKSAIQNISANPGGLEWMMNAEKSMVDVNGQQVSPKALFSTEQWENMKLKATSVQFDRDAAVKEKFQIGIASVLHNPNMDDAERQLAILKEDLNKAQPTNISTPERDQITQLETQLIARRAQENEKLKKDLVKKNQDSNKALVIGAQFDKRLSGSYVPTDAANMPTNDSTGPIAREDVVNYANKRLQQIDQMDLPQEQKDDLKMQYLKADSEKGPFREIMGTMVSDAQKEWQGAVVNGKMPENHPAIDQLRRVRQRDPVSFGQLYPEQAAFFNTLDTMDQMGVDPQIIIDADRQQKAQSKDQLRQADENWKSLKNDSKAPELARIPTQMDSTARQIYDATLYRTGNNDLARQQVTRFLQENTVTFTDDNVEGDNRGVVPRGLLMVTSDPASYSQGKAIIEHAVAGITQTNPWVTAKNLDITSQGDSIFITDTTGQIRRRYDKDMIQRVYADEQQRALTKQQDEAIAKAQKRAPIAAVNQAKQQSEARRREKAKKVPKYIYGGPSETTQKVGKDIEAFGDLLNGKKPKQ